MSHSVHDIAPDVGLCRPAPQSVHVADPDADHVPARHGEHIGEPLPAYVPASQRVLFHPSQAKPAGHVVHVPLLSGAVPG